MAAHSNNFIRVRLHFDYAPPGAVSCRMCWLLVDLNTCRVVSDLESVIRQKFELSRRSILSLFVEDCYLPHTESIYVVRDNDCVRVKVDSVAQATGHGTSPGSSKENGRKRRRPEAGDENEEDRKTELENGFELKKKKRKKHAERSKKDGEQPVLSDETTKKKKKEHKEKKRQREPEETASAASSKPTPAKKPLVEEQSKSIKKPPVTQLRKQNVSSSESSSSSEEDAPPKKTSTPKPPTKTPAAPSKPALTATKTPVNVEERSKSIKKPPVTQQRKQNVSSSESSSSSEEDVPPKKTPTPKLPLKTPDASKKPPNSIPAKKAPPSSSSSSDSSSDDAVGSKKTPINTPLTSTVANGKINTSLQSTSCVQGPAALPPDSNSEEEIKLVIRRPVQQLGGGGAGGLPPWRGRGRGKARQGRGRGGPFRGCGFESNYHGDNDRPYSGDSQTNVSVVLQNGEQTAPKRDYSSMPLLAAPPQVGQNIAFMLLELTESYTPEVSEYKEAKIVNFDPTTKQIELELLNASHAQVEPGKFDLVYQNPDGSERVEYAVARSSRVTERWDALLEPRLII